MRVLRVWGELQPQGVVEAAHLAHDEIWLLEGQKPAMCPETVNAWGESEDFKAGVRERYAETRGPVSGGEGSQEAEDHGMGGN